MRTRIAAVAIAAVLLGAGAATVALHTSSRATAQSAPGQAPARTAPQWMTDALKKLVDAGTITQAQADAVSKALVAAKPHVGLQASWNDPFKALSALRERQVEGKCVLSVD